MKKLARNAVGKDSQINAHQLCGTFIEKLDAFRILYTDDQKPFKDMTLIDFHSCCVRENIFRDTYSYTGSVSWYPYLLHSLPT